MLAGESQKMWSKFASNPCLMKTHSKVPIKRKVPWIKEESFHKEKYFKSHLGSNKVKVGLSPSKIFYYYLLQ